VELANATNAAISDGRGQGTITNDDAVPTLSISDAMGAEPSAPAPFTFTVTLSTASGRTVTAGYAAANGTAVAGSDFTQATGTVSFAAGETSKTIAITVSADTMDEPDETFTVTLSNPVNATIADASGEGRITDDDAPATVSIEDVSVTEGNTGTATATATVSLSAASGFPVTVTYATADDTALAASDYTAGSGMVNFAAGETSKTVAVTIAGDILKEMDESFFINLSGAANATIADGQGRVTILSDDAGGPPIAVADASTAEGNAGTTTVTFTVTLGFVSPDTVTVAYATADDTAASGGAAASGGLDYLPASDVVTFAPGETSKSVTVTVNGDVLNEANETFTVNLSGAVNGTLGDPQAVGTITNDDALPTVAIGDVSVSEGAAGTRQATFTVSLSDPSGRPVTAAYATADDTATTGGAAAAGGNDYLAGMGTVTFGAGDTSAIVTVTVNGDTVNEPDETFLVNLSAVVNATAADAQGRGTINNDDGQPALAIADLNVVETDMGVTNATFTVTLSAGSSQTVTVDYATAEGTAMSPLDYMSGSGTLTFMPGVTSVSFSVNVKGDEDNEPNETFLVNLSNPTNATIADSQATATIINDDSTLPGISINNATLTEGNGGTPQLTFTATLSRASTDSVTVKYATANGTATAGSDYTAATGTITFAAGETARAVQVTITSDTANEADETFFVDLSDPTNAVILDGRGQGTITNDDAAPTLSVGDATTTEGDAGTKTSTFTVTLSAVSGQTVTASYATADGTATAAGTAATGGLDYLSASGTLSFAPGETSKTVSVTINGDALNEPDETFTVDLSNAQKASIADAQGTGTLTNDDMQPTLSINDVSALEGDAGLKTFTFTVTLSAPSGRQVTVNHATADGTGVAPVDYIPGMGTLTFAPGETTQTVEVSVVGNIIAEDNETFAVGLSGAMNATIADAQGQGTIGNDD
jgi:large repetitive protein